MYSHDMQSRSIHSASVLVGSRQNLSSLKRGHSFARILLIIDHQLQPQTVTEHRQEIHDIISLKYREPQWLLNKVLGDYRMQVPD